MHIALLLVRSIAVISNVTYFCYFVSLFAEKGGGHGTKENCFLKYQQVVSISLNACCVYEIEHDMVKNVQYFCHEDK